MKNKDDFNIQLAAIDAIDAARSQDELLNEEVNIDVRKANFKAKLKKTYSEQNINVDDKIIDGAIDKIFERRNEFRPINSRFHRWVAHVYINRRRYGFRAALSAAVVIALIIAYIFTGTLITRAKQARKERELAALQKAHAEKLAAHQREEERAKAAALSETQRKKALAEELAALPGKLKAAHAAISEITKEDGVRTKSAALLSEGVFSVTANNIDRARTILGDMEKLLKALSAEYTIVVNQTGGKVGLWRTYDKNPNQKRYYIIVNAVDANNQPVQVEIRNEEDGSIKTTSQWGEQVSLEEFERIKADRQNRGVVTNPIFAKKEKGYLSPQYSQGLKSSNKYDAATFRITRW